MRPLCFSTRTETRPRASTGFSAFWRRGGTSGPLASTSEYLRPVQRPGRGALSTSSSANSTLTTLSISRECSPGRTNPSACGQASRLAQASHGLRVEIRIDLARLGLGFRRSDRRRPRRQAQAIRHRANRLPRMDHRHDSHAAFSLRGCVTRTESPQERRSQSVSLGHALSQESPIWPGDSGARVLLPSVTEWARQ